MNLPTYQDTSKANRTEDFQPPGYKLSQSLHLDSIGLTDGYYYVEIVNQVFRCKVLDIVNGQLHFNAESLNIHQDQIDLDQQAQLQERYLQFAQRQRFHSHIKTTGYYSSQHSRVYQPESIRVDSFSNTLLTHTGDIITSLDGDSYEEQIRLLRKHYFGAFYSDFQEITARSIQYMKNPAKYHRVLVLRSQTTGFFSQNILRFYQDLPSDPVLKSTLDTSHILLELFQDPLPNPNSILDTLQSYSNFDSCPSLHIETFRAWLQHFLPLREYFNFNYRLVGLKNLNSLDSLVSFYDLALEYQNLSTTNPSLYQALQKIHYYQKLQAHLDSLLDTHKLKQLIESGCQHIAANQVKLLVAMLQRPSFQNFAFAHSTLNKARMLQDSLGL